MRNEKGQTMVIVVLVMLMALSVGVAISTRFLTSVRRNVRLDSSARAVSVAEALVERLLNEPYEDLEGYINAGNCGSVCTLSITGADGVVASALATLSFAGGTSQAFEAQLVQDEIFEANLTGYPDNTPLSICWNAPISGELPSIYATLVLGSVGNYSVETFAYNSTGSIYSDNGFTDATASLGYENCFDINSSTAPKAVRLKAFYNDAIVYLVPSAGATLPSQGINIESTGTVLDAQRKVKVLLTNTFMPAAFDYVIYSKSESVPLSN